MGEFAADTVDYINKLLNVTNLTVDRLFIVPGNHDIERDAEGRAEAYFRKYQGLFSEGWCFSLR